MISDAYIHFVHPVVGLNSDDPLDDRRLSMWAESVEFEDGYVRIEAQTKGRWETLRVPWSNIASIATDGRG